MVLEAVGTGGGAPCRVVCTTVTVGDVCGGLPVLDVDVSISDEGEDEESEVVLAKVDAGDFGEVSASIHQVAFD